MEKDKHLSLKSIFVSSVVRFFRHPVSLQPGGGIMYKMVTEISIWLKRGLAAISIILLAMGVFLFEVPSVAAFNADGGRSRPFLAFNDNSSRYDKDSRGYYRVDPGSRNYRSYSRPEYYSEDRRPGLYRSQPSSPYGSGWRGGYGERRAIQSSRDAQRMLNDYYTRRSMRIGPMRENQFYYEADILDRNNRFIDKVIIDKRSGRIRSIY